MSLIITQRPVANIDSFNVSKWNAAFSPIIYKGQRQDKTVKSVKIYNSSSVKVTWNAEWTKGTSISEIETGTSIYLNSGKYDGVYDVLSVLTDAVILDVNLGVESTGGYLNYVSKRKNYYIAIELYRIVDNEYVKISDAIFRPLPNGQFTFDFSSMLQKHISFQNTFDYDTLNERDLNISGGFNFRVKKVWQGSNNSFSIFSDKDITYYTGSSKQLREQYGTNMAKYVPVTNNVDLFDGDFANGLGWDITSSGSDKVFYKGVFYWMGINGAFVTLVNNRTTLTPGASYVVVIKIKTIQNAKITLVCGTTSGAEITTVGIHKQTIISNGTSFYIKIESTGLGSHKASLEYVQISADVNTHLAKFLMDDFEPTLFAGYPFDLSFIFSDNIQSLELNRVRNFLDINKTAISSSTTALDVSSNTFAVNRLLIEPISSDLPAGTKYIDCYLEVGTDAKETGVYVQGTMDGQVFNAGVEPLQQGSNYDLTIHP